MEIASNKGVIADASTPAGRAGMSESEWREAIKFDSTDTGWVIMSIGMAIGAGIVFLPVQVGLMGLWVFLLSSVIGYPAMYLFQRLFINTLAESPECKDYPSVISGYLGPGINAFTRCRSLTSIALSGSRIVTANQTDS